MQKTYLSYQVFTKASPLRQALWVLGIGILLMFIGGWISEDEELPWFIGCTALGFYVWLNAVISFFITKKWLSYFFKSLALFAVLSLVIYLVADMISSITVVHLYEYRSMYSITVLFYILGMAVVSLMRNIAQMLRINY